MATSALSPSPSLFCNACRQQRTENRSLSPPLSSLSSPLSSLSLPLRRRLPGGVRRDATANVSRRNNPRGRMVKCSASGASAGEYPGEEDPYMVLGVSELKGFDAMVVAHRKKTKIAEKKGDKEAIEKYDRAYNKIMMRQLDMRRRGISTGSMEVSKDIKYADKRAIFPWLPRYSPVGKKDLLINAAISGTFSLWILASKVLEWRALQFLIFSFIFRTFLKLKGLAKAPKREEEEESRRGRDEQNRGILLRSLGLVFGGVGGASLGYSVVVRVFLAMGSYPLYVATGQELFVTVFTALALFIIATFYR